MKFLVLGGNGLVGKELQSILTQKGYPFVATYRNNNTEGKVVADITNAEQLAQVFNDVKPTVVINAVNLAGGVDYCENNPDIAHQHHFLANKNIADLALQHNAKFVMISTDYVFDGTKPPYSEDDEPNPLNVYGKEKLAAERYMLDTVSNSLVCRTTNVFGWDPNTKTPNYLIGIYPKLQAGERVNAPSFLQGNPTYANDLAGAIVALVEKEATGIYNVVGPECINRYQWATRFCEIMGLDATLLNNIEAPPANMVPRPLQSNLKIDKLLAATHYPMKGVEEGLQAFKAAALATTPA